jgi:hypothetical protein
VSEQALAAERAIDHGTLIIELLTKSYEQFKKYKSGRMTLFLASEIARVYQFSGKHEMALKFFERIGRTYRKENWPAVIKSLLTQSVECGKVLGRRENVVEFLVELLSERITSHDKERAMVLDELMAVLNGEETWGRDVPRAPRLKISVDMDQINSFLGCSVQFKKANGYVRGTVPFQVTLKGDGTCSPPTSMRLSQIRVSFSTRKLDHVWYDAGDSGSTGLLQWVDCTSTTREMDPDPLPNQSIEAEASSPTAQMVSVAKVDLGIAPGVRKVFEGNVVPTESEDLKITLVTLVIETPSSALTLNYKIGDRAEDSSTRRKWLSAESIGNDYILFETFYTLLLN